MSALENDAKPILTSLIQQDRALDSLARAERLTLARWDTKTAYTLEAGGLEPHVPLEHFVALREELQLPASVAVFATRHESTRKWFFAAAPTWAGVWLTSDGQAKVSDLSYKIAMQFGSLILIVIYWPLDGWNYRVERDALTKIWPVTSAAVAYEHPHAMTSNTSENLCYRLCLSVTMSPSHSAESWLKPTDRDRLA